MSTELRDILGEIHTCNNGEDCLKCDNEEAKKEDDTDYMRESKDIK